LSLFIRWRCEGCEFELFPIQSSDDDNF